MQNLWTRRIAPLLLVLPLCGCGTLMNLRTPAPGQTTSASRVPRTIYGGVRLDAAAGRRSFEAAGEYPAQALVGAFVWGVDLPASAVAATLTLPLTVPAAINREIERYYFPPDQPPHATAASDSYPPPR